MSPLIDALGLAILAVGMFLIAARRAQWLSWLPRGPETPPAPRNTPLRRTSGDGNPPPPKNTRVKPRDDGDAFKRYATFARERRGYAALVTATALLALVFGGCGFLPPISDTTRIETPTVSGVNAVTEVNRYGGVVNSTRVTVPPSSIQDCARFLSEALPVPTANTHSQTTAWLAWMRLQTRLLCMQQQQRMGPNMLGAGAFPGGRTFKGGGER